MKVKSALLAVATVSALGASAVHADNVYWSVGVSQPGVHLGVSNAPRPVYQPAPVVVVQQPVYSQGFGQPYGQPYYGQQVVVQPAPVVTYQPYPVYRPYPVVQTAWVQPGWHHGWREREWREHEWRQHERFEHGRGHR